MPHSNCDSISKRKKLLDELGKLPEAIVENQEWLYMLAEKVYNKIIINNFRVTNLLILSPQFYRNAFDCE